jgi:hypothetical protein
MEVSLRSLEKQPVAEPENNIGVGHLKIIINKLYLKIILHTKIIDKKVVFYSHKKEVFEFIFTLGL